MNTRFIKFLITVSSTALTNNAFATIEHGFFEDAHATISSRTMHYSNDNHNGGGDQREAATALKLDYISGFTQGTVGMGLDVSALTALHLDGGKGHHPDANTFFPSDSDGSAAHSWGRIGANFKARISKTELRVGTALTPNLPIIVATDSRLVYQNFSGGVINSKEFESLTLNFGRLDHSYGRATSNDTALSVAGGTKGSNGFKFAGGDWKATKDLTVQYYFANLENYYKQSFVGLVHVLPLGTDRSLKSDLRYFDSTSDGKNGEVGYRFNNNGGYAKNPGEVDNKTWSATMTYSQGGHSILLGHESISEDGGFVWLNQGNVVDGRNRAEGNGGTAFYLLTDMMIGNFSRAGEKSNIGQYAFDFSKIGIPGLKASVTYVKGESIRDVRNQSDHAEWERDARIDYVIPKGTFKDLGFTIRHATYRGDGSALADQDQTRIILNYSYTFL